MKRFLRKCIVVYNFFYLPKRSSNFLGENVRKIYLFILPYNDFTIQLWLWYLALIRPVFCTGAILKPNRNKVCEKKFKK